MLLKIKLPSGIVFLVKKQSLLQAEMVQARPLKHREGCPLMAPAIRPALRYWLVES